MNMEGYQHHDLISLIISFAQGLKFLQSIRMFGFWFVLGVVYQYVPVLYYLMVICSLNLDSICVVST